MNRPPWVIASPGDFAGSGHYRVIFPLQTADVLGYIKFRMPDQPIFLSPEFLADFRPDSLLLQRTHTHSQLKYVQHLRDNHDILLAYELDDWFERVPKYSPHFKHVSTLGKEVRKVINLVDRVVVTNDLLANVYGSKKETYIIPNYISETIWTGVYNVGRIPVPRVDNRPRIGWSGGLGHGKEKLGDLELLRDIARELGDSVRWVLLGSVPTDFLKEIPNLSAPEPATQKEYPHALYGLDLDLAFAPLVDNDFNKAKSNLRLLEYGVCGYPVIASDVKPYRDAVIRESCPVTLLPWNAKTWVDTIKSKLADLDKLKEEGEILKKWVWANYKLEDHVMEYSKLLSPDDLGFDPKKQSSSSDIVDVIITTRNNPRIVKRCVDSVITSLGHNKTPINIIISDDASDNPELLEYFAKIKAEFPRIEFNHHENNIGYTDNVNSAIELHPDHDVITLNSDAYPVNDWVDRLRTEAYKNARIASVTPLSNNATINSYPNPEGSELSESLVQLYDRLAKELDAPAAPLVSSIGFCQYLTRRALNDVGLFDSHGFGRGYGEENDWSLRAMMRLWTNAAACNVYVGHEGTVTFGNERETLQQRANKVLAARWPTYTKALEQWFKVNPLATVRQSLDIATIKTITTAPRTLYITHTLGGGVETHLQQLLKQDSNAVIARMDYTNPGTLRIEIPNDKYFNLPLINTRFITTAQLKTLFNDFKVNKIYVETTYGFFDYTFPIWIMNLAQALAVPYEVMLHDYWTVCPRLRLIGDEVAYSYCGEPNEETCNKCISTNGTIVGQTYIQDWRKMHLKFLETAKAVYAPSHDLKNRIYKHFSSSPKLVIDVMPHESDIEIGQWTGCYRPYVEGNELNVAIIGNIMADKGAILIADCAEYCLTNKLPIKFHVFGNMINNILPQPIPYQSTSNLHIHGQYDSNEQLIDMLRKNPCTVSLFMSLWPETYSYTLSNAFRAGLWPIAFDLGAFPERINEYNYGNLMPFDLFKNDPASIVNTIMVAAETRK